MSNEENEEEEEEKGEIKKALKHFFDSVRNALVDLTTLEVNSILVSNISAEHPTEDSEFLKQTCEDLVTWFESHKLEDKLKISLTDDFLAKLKDLCTKAQDKEIIQGLRNDLNKCIEQKKPVELTEKQKRERSEYRRHLFYLDKYLYLHEQWIAQEQKPKEEIFTDRERQQLRKIWELVPTTFIYAQTVLQLDGDIISRINDQLFSEARENAEELMRVHKSNVEAGVNYRNGLLRTFVQILRSVLGI
jgi:hypothetical protein